MSNVKYAHIAQDASGLLLEGSGAPWVGLVTDHVESCVIYCFECEHGVIMCHDSGQLAIDDIVATVSKAGPVKGVKTLRYAGLKVEQFSARLDKLRERLNVPGLSVDEITCPSIPFVAIYTAETGLWAATSLPEGTQSPEDIPYRWAVAKLNNAFIPANAQSLPANLQFDGNNYLPALGPLTSLEKVLAMIGEQPKFFFMNLSVLVGAAEARVLEVPKRILAFASAYGVTAKGWSRFYDERVAFEIFKRQGFPGLA